MLIRRFNALLFRHGMIQKQIDAEHGAPKPDAIRLFRLKRLRLVLKDRLRKIARMMEAEQAQRQPAIVGGTEVGGAR